MSLSCLFTTPAAFYTATVFGSETPFPLKYDSDTYNCISWSVSNARYWMTEPLRSYGSALNFYDDFGFRRVDCADPSAVVALYCLPADPDQKDHNGGCRYPSRSSQNPQNYTHAAAYTPYMGRTGWGSKFGWGALLSMGSMQDITNTDPGPGPGPENCTKYPSRYGKVALCF